VQIPTRGPTSTPHFERHGVKNFLQKNEKMFQFLRLKNGSDIDPRIQEYFTGILFHSTMLRNKCFKRDGLPIVTMTA
jgi:hypothetical protein